MISTHLIDEIADILEEVIIIDRGRLILHRPVEELLESAYSVFGEASRVDQYIQGKNCLSEERLQNFKTAIVLAEQWTGLWPNPWIWRLAVQSCRNCLSHLPALKEESAMARVWSFTKYQLRDYRPAVLVFYLVLAVIAAFILAINGRVEGQASLSGGSIIFVFVIGLNCFKSSFLFAQANNISRWVFYQATLLSLVGLGIIMGAVDMILDAALQRLPIYLGLFEQLYGKAPLAKGLWTTASLVFAGSLGWMITMIYYRSSNLWKVVVSLIPVLISPALSLLNWLTNGRLTFSLFAFLKWAFGFAGESPNPYPAVLTFLAGSVLIWAINAVLLYRAPVKG